MKSLLNFLKQINKYLNNNKTIIGTILLLITTMPAVSVWLGDNLLVTQTIIGLLTGASLVSHIHKQIPKKK